ncbi:MATE family efflux transporter [Methanobacterium sp.]|uniref:MATE family efflux transporter n=1 Tax=Methanobacterium sp. TaxID=2164 RepID=UPI003C7708E8
MFERNYNILSKKYNEFFLPTLLISMAINITVIVETIIVGITLGATNVAAMALVAPIFALFAMIYLMFAFGGSTVVSIAKAERKEDKANMYFTMSILSLLIIGVLIAVFGNIYIDSIAALVTSNATLSILFKNYVSIFFLGAPLLFIIMGMPFFMRVDDKPKLASTVVIVVNIVNIIMDLVFIVIFGMGIAGAALGFVAGALVGLIFIFKYLMSSERTMHFISLSKCKLSSIYDITSSGLSSASGQFFMFLKLTLINIIVYSVLGAPGLAAFAVCYQLLSIVFIAISGISQSMSPIVSIFYGETDYSGVKFTIKRSLKIMVAACIGFVIIFEAFPVLILSLFGITSPEYVAVGINAIRIYSLSLIGTGISFLMLYYTQAIQQKTLSLAISVTQGLLILIPSAYLLPGIMGADGIWISFLLAEIGTMIMIFIATRIISKRSSEKYSGIFLLEKYDNASVLDVTIHSSVEDAVGLSEELINFAKESNVDNKTAVLIGLAVEEMAVNTIKYNGNEIKFIDILSKIGEEEITISFKDSGVEFDPSTYTCEEKDLFENIEVLQKIADDISYARLIGLNSTVITIKR